MEDDGCCLTYKLPQSLYLGKAKSCKSLLQNQLTDGLESWYVALSTQVLPRFSNDDLGLTVTVSTVMSNMGENANTQMSWKVWKILA